ncbi:hypothetical protein PoB_002862200 [Plakobranchus ocellatus]|uniref:Uncharacterized protein n=1 Tax=Plakobranchus ocellatus TaxID=259542 RepID=A0AAV4A5D3_9GAST|nr:hypothetical protein PoB_002862200 [Plakobranchus ocellatus]
MLDMLEIQVVEATDLTAWSQQTYLGGEASLLRLIGLVTADYLGGEASQLRLVDLVTADYLGGEASLLRLVDLVTADNLGVEASLLRLVDLVTADYLGGEASLLRLIGLVTADYLGDDRSTFLTSGGGVGGTVASEFALRSAGSLLSRIPAPPPALRTETSLQEKAAILESVGENFVDKVKNYISAMKEAILAGTPDIAEEIFQPAMEFLTQDLPGHACLATASQTGDYEGDVTKLRVVAADSKRIKDKLDGLKNKLRAQDPETKERKIDLSEVSKANSNAVKSLQKLLTLKRQKKQAAAVTPSPTAVSTPDISGPLKEVRQRSTSFSATVETDPDIPEIQDVQLLPGGRILVSDGRHRRLKLFDIEGEHLYTMECRDTPKRLAVIESAGDCHSAAVTLPDRRRIYILQVTADKIKVEVTVRTDKQYEPVAAVNKLALAVGCNEILSCAIDLIDLQGRFLRQINASTMPLYMDITKDRHLVTSDVFNRIAIARANTGRVLFSRSVPQIKEARGVAVAPDGSILVADSSNKTLHLLSSKVAWNKQLWSVPSDEDEDDELWNVSTDGQVCICATRDGSVYILDCVH